MNLDIHARAENSVMWRISAQNRSYWGVFLRIQVILFRLWADIGA